ncbi:MAG: hypothetical protein H0U27_04160 [Nitrosopumilus sp.]|nr:hypothetical protein [Nitrosopumilus sp.]
MNSADKSKLKHDFINSIVIINSMTKSAENFLNRLSSSTDENIVNQQQMQKFIYSMNTIREQTAKIENYFHSFMND